MIKTDIPAVIPVRERRKCLQKLKSFLKENKKFKWILSFYRFLLEKTDLIKYKIKHIYILVYSLKYHYLPLENKIVFLNFDGRGFGCNPKYIALELLKRNCDFDLVWLVNQRDSFMPKSIRQILIDSKESFKKLATAKVIINNVKGEINFNKRKGQFYIQTWHAGFSPKLLENDAFDTLPDSYLCESKKRTRNEGIMKKIGIITFWGVPNYGTFLQAYALKNTIQSFDTSFEVEVIPYLNKSHYKVYYGLNPVKCRYKYIRPKFYLSLVKSIIKYFRNKCKEKKFLSFYRNLSLSDRITGEELKERYYDTVILGSDIIWDFSISFFGNDRFLFGLDLNCTNKIAYAASFGTTRYGKTIPEYVYQGINELNAVSVRESNSQAIVKVLTGQEPQIVCDPTFLWDFENDKNIPKENKYGEYIIVYGSSFGSELISGCVDYARKNNFKIICLDSLDDSFEWCDINIRQNDLSPFEWLAMFKNAKIVMTCTFHGLMFGLIFKKKIAFNPLKFILDKAESFIDFLELRKPLIELNSFSDKINWPWDYTIINEKLKELWMNSTDYLRKNL